MDICLMIEGQEDVTWEDWVSLALACEEHGFQALFRSDHYLSMSHPTDWGNLDAWSTIAALSARTERLRLGTLVSPVTFRHPSHLAKAVVTADHASEGRVELGIGAGWFDAEHRTFGFAFPQVRSRMEMLEEQVAIIHRFWNLDEGEVTFEGRHYRVQAANSLPKPVQHPHIPIILGGGAGPWSTRIAARWADEYNMNFVPPERCREGRARLDAACEAFGRDPGEVAMSLMTTTVVGEDQQDLEAKAGRLMERRGASGDVGGFIEQLRGERIIGTVDQVLARLDEYARAGVRRVMMQHLLHRDLGSLALIGRAVIPEAAGL